MIQRLVDWCVLVPVTFSVPSDPLAHTSMVLLQRISLGRATLDESRMRGSLRSGNELVQARSLAGEPLSIWHLRLIAR